MKYFILLAGENRKNSAFFIFSASLVVTDLLFSSPTSLFHQGSITISHQVRSDSRSSLLSLSLCSFPSHSHTYQPPPPTATGCRSKVLIFPCCPERARYEAWFFFFFLSSFFERNRAPPIAGGRHANTRCGVAGSLASSLSPTLRATALQTQSASSPIGSIALFHVFQSVIPIRIPGARSDGSRPFDLFFSCVRSLPLKLLRSAPISR